MKTYQKEARIGEITIYQEILNPIADTYNKLFSVLILPKSISIDINHNRIALPFYEGQTFNDLWNESTGGSLLGLELSFEVPQILYELSLVDITAFYRNEELKKIPKLIFDHAIYFSELSMRLKKFSDTNLLSEKEMGKALELLKEPHTSPLMLNNGDFYPRNFIRTSGGKIVLIDWETWNSHSPFYIFDHLENIAALCFVNMWNNKPWQKNYIKELWKRFSLKPEDFQRAILIKSLEMAEFWFKDNGNNDLCKNQMTLFRNALSKEYLEVNYLRQ